MLLAARAEPAEPAADVFVAVAKPERGRDAFLLLQRLRASGLRAEMEQAGRAMKGQLKQANRVGARATVIVGDEIEVKDMDGGGQRPAESPEAALELVGELLAGSAGSPAGGAGRARAEGAGSAGEGAS
jgi:histidyl-tRNA synthetase